MSDYQGVTDCPICPQLATDRDDALCEAEALRAQIEQQQATIAHQAQELAFEGRCTPAERALIDAAVAWRPAMRAFRDRRTTERYAAWAELHDAMCVAADAVLTERGGNAAPECHAIDAVSLDGTCGLCGTEHPVDISRCPNCDHDAHHGERCDGDADGDECVCSWPDPDNFTGARP